jgi:hypothetical protein
MSCQQASAVQYWTGASQLTYPTADGQNRRIRFVKHQMRALELEPELRDSRSVDILAQVPARVAEVTRGTACLQILPRVCDSEKGCREVQVSAFPTEPCFLAARKQVCIDVFIDLAADYFGSEFVFERE